MNREPTFMLEPRTEELAPQSRATRKRTSKATPARSAEHDEGLLTLLLGLEDEATEATSSIARFVEVNEAISVVEATPLVAEFSEENLVTSAELEEQVTTTEFLASLEDVDEQEQSQFPCQSSSSVIAVDAEQVSTALSVAEREQTQLEARGETEAVEYSLVAVSEATATQTQLEKLVAQLVGTESESESQAELEELEKQEKLVKQKELIERGVQNEQEVQDEQAGQAEQVAQMTQSTETAQAAQGEPATQVVQETARELQLDVNSSSSSAPSTATPSAARTATPFVAPLQVTPAPRVLVDSFILPPTLGMMSVRGVVGQEVTVAQLQEQVTSQVATAIRMSAQLATARSMPLPSQSQQVAEMNTKKQKAPTPTSRASTTTTQTNNAELEFARLLGFNNLSKLFKVTPELRQWVKAWQEGQLPLSCATPVEARTRVQAEHAATTSSSVRSFIFPWEQVLTSSKELQVLVASWLADIDNPTFTQPQLMELELWYWIYQFTQQYFEQVLTPTRLELLAHYLGLVRGVHALGTELDTSGGVWQALHQLREIPVTQYQVKDAHLYRNLVRELQAVTLEQVQERLHALRLRKQQLQQEQQVREQLATPQTLSPATRAGKENHHA